MVMYRGELCLPAYVESAKKSVIKTLGILRENLDWIKSGRETVFFIEHDGKCLLASREGARSLVMRQINRSITAKTEDRSHYYRKLSDFYQWRLRRDHERVRQYRRDLQPVTFFETREFRERFGNLT